MMQETKIANLFLTVLTVLFAKSNVGCVDKVFNLDALYSQNKLSHSYKNYCITYS